MMAALEGSDIRHGRRRPPRRVAARGPRDCCTAANLHVAVGVVVRRVARAPQTRARKPRGCPSSISMRSHRNARPAQLLGHVRRAPELLFPRHNSAPVILPVCHQIRFTHIRKPECTLFLTSIYNLGCLINSVLASLGRTGRFYSPRAPARRRRRPRFAALRWAQGLCNKKKFARGGRGSARARGRA